MSLKNFNIGEVQFGADPELCAVDDDDIAIPAWLITDGRKDSHEKLRDLLDIDIHADGVALEFNFKAVRYDQLHTHVANVFDRVRKKVLAGKGGASNLIITPQMGFSKEYLMHPLALNSGCDPDFCAYDEEIKPRIVTLDLMALPVRYFGGHLHVGYNVEMLPPWALTRIMDAVWYLGWLKKDDQKGRRGVYGKAGIYRPKSYGVEYRTPSPFWVRNANATYQFAHDMVCFLSLLAEQPKQVNRWFHEQSWKDIKDVIDNYNLEDAAKLHKEIKTSLTKLGMSVSTTGTGGE